MSSIAVRHELQAYRLNTATKRHVARVATPSANPSLGDRLSLQSSPSSPAFGAEAFTLFAAIELTWLAQP
jgi:hypothetical protein